MWCTRCQCEGRQTFTHFPSHFRRGPGTANESLVIASASTRFNIKSYDMIFVLFITVGGKWRRSLELSRYLYTHHTRTRFRRGRARRPGGATLPSGSFPRDGVILMPGFRHLLFYPHIWGRPERRTLKYSSGYAPPSSIRLEVYPPPTNALLSSLSLGGKASWDPVTDA